MQQAQQHHNMFAGGTLQGQHLQAVGSRDRQYVRISSRSSSRTPCLQLTDPRTTVGSRNGQHVGTSSCSCSTASSSPLQLLLTPDLQKDENPLRAV